MIGEEEMNVLILGANGELGPHVVRALECRHQLRLTDINDLRLNTSTSEQTRLTLVR